MFFIFSLIRHDELNIGRYVDTHQPLVVSRPASKGFGIYSAPVTLSPNRHKYRATSLLPAFSILTPLSLQIQKEDSASQILVFLLTNPPNPTRYDYGIHAPIKSRTTLLH